ncbi:MAG: phage head-tail connector protein [Pseudomonadales bacterium]|nr:phage head-tail connector protein [Pseudomonadales bacterium]
MPLTLVTPPASEPMLLGEVKSDLRIDDDDNDLFLEGLIVVARDFAESETNRALISQTWDLNGDCFVPEVMLPKPGLISVDSISYVDADRIVQVLDSSVYQVDAVSLPGRIRPAFDQQWPTTRKQMNAVTIRFTCGYGSRLQVPRGIKKAMVLLIGHYFKNREETTDKKQYTLPNGVSALLGPYIIPRTMEY